MPQVKNLVISAGRKCSANYNTRDAQFTVTVEMSEGDDPKAVLNAWTKRLQMACDRAVGDPSGVTSFSHTTRYAEPFPEPANPQPS